MATLTVSDATDLTALILEKRLNRKKKTIWADRRKRPFLYWLEGMKKSTGIAKDFVSITQKFNAELTQTTWSGDVTLPAAGTIRNHITLDFYYANFWQAFKIVHDHYRQMGITIIPNAVGQDFGGRAKPMAGSEYEMMVNKVNEDLDSFEDSFERNLDLNLHKQGTSADDIIGLNGILPASLTGNYAGYAREQEPLLHHAIWAGAAGGVGGADYLGASGTYGTAGTLLATIEKAMRIVRANAAMSELGTGEWVAFAGAGMIEAIKSEYRRLGLTYNRQASGGGKVDLILLDEDLEIGRLPIVWDPTLDQMDTVASSERGVGLSAGTVTITAASGDSGTGATAVAYINASGAVADVTIINRGSGYEAAPAINVTGATGTNATFQAYFFGTGTAATGKTVVAAGDPRIGKLDKITVTSGGSGYTAGTTLNFTDRLYLLYKPAWSLLYQDGLDKRMSIPADSARARATEVQCDATYFLINKLQRVNALIHSKSV